MMGHVVNLLLEFVRENAGDKALQEVFEQANVEPASYRFEVIYPEAEFASLLAACIKVLGTTPGDAEIAFAEYFMQVSPRLFAAYFEVSPSTRLFLERLPELHRSLPKAASELPFRDKVSLLGARSDAIRLGYESPHELCKFFIHAIGLLFKYYGETGDCIELCCTREGAPRCEIEVRFDDEPVAAA
ncbi:MAG: heme NO-binding domain-containing protein [Planctomycetota bacterium]|nr:heme NO-binding domain-containing protein [Planctomycetota bacterium]